MPPVLQPVDSTPAICDRDLKFLGVVTALLAPAIGFVVAIMLFFRGMTGPGVGTLLLCPIGIPISLVFWGHMLQDFV